MRGTIDEDITDIVRCRGVAFIPHRAGAAIIQVRSVLELAEVFEHLN